MYFVVFSCILTRAAREAALEIPLPHQCRHAAIDYSLWFLNILRLKSFVFHVFFRKYHVALYLTSARFFFFVYLDQGRQEKPPLKSPFPANVDVFLQ